MNNKEMKNILKSFKITIPFSIKINTLIVLDSSKTLIGHIVEVLAIAYIDNNTVTISGKINTAKTNTETIELKLKEQGFENSEIINAIKMFYLLIKNNEEVYSTSYNSKNGIMKIINNYNGKIEELTEEGPIFICDGAELCMIPE